MKAKETLHNASASSVKNERVRQIRYLYDPSIYCTICQAAITNLLIYSCQLYHVGRLLLLLSLRHCFYDVGSGTKLSVWVAFAVPFVL
jgi:hypothetical protein